MSKDETLHPKSIQAIAKSIEQRVRKSYVNVAGVDLAAWATEFRRSISELPNKNTEVFENTVREHLKQLKASHTAFYHGFQARFLPQHSINATLKSVGSNGSQRWMFLDVFPEGPAEKAGIRPGESLLAIDKVAAIPPTLPAIKTGETYTLSVAGAADDRVRDVTVAVPFRKGTKQRPPIVEPKAVTARVLPGDVGVLQIPYFSGAAGMRFGTSLASAIVGLKSQGVKRLIVDLRGNIGGSLGFSILASYMCPDQRPIGYSITPTSVRKGYEKEKLPRVPMPKTKPALLFTLAEFALRDKSVALLTQGLGPQPFHGRIVVLVNEWTNSAGEMAASFAKENKLGVLVGTKTAGNVLGAANFKVGNDYFLRIPIFGWMTWRGMCLEGAGVQPDVAVENEPGRLARGVDAQFDAAIEIASRL